MRLIAAIIVTSCLAAIGLVGVFPPLTLSRTMRTPCHVGSADSVESGAANDCGDAIPAPFSVKADIPTAIEYILIILAVSIGTYAFCRVVILRKA